MTATTAPNLRPIHILLVEDTPTDIQLTLAAFNRVKLSNQVSVVTDGRDALAFLRREGNHAAAPRPDMILLDLKLPGLDGHEVLAAIKADKSLQRIPVVVLTTSPKEVNVLRSYDLHANCYITKPVRFEEFADIISRLENFWFSIVLLPSLLPAAESPAT